MPAPEQVYAWRVPDPPRHPPANPRAPVTGWVHENGPPWRVITGPEATLRATLPTWDTAPYDGDEQTVSHADWMAAELGRIRHARSIALVPGMTDQGI